MYLTQVRSVPCPPHNRALRLRSNGSRVLDRQASSGTDGRAGLPPTFRPVLNAPLRVKTRRCTDPPILTLHSAPVDLSSPSTTSPSGLHYDQSKSTARHRKDPSLLVVGTAEGLSPSGHSGHFLHSSGQHHGQVQVFVVEVLFLVHGGERASQISQGQSLAVQARRCRRGGRFAFSRFSAERERGGNVQYLNWTALHVSTFTQQGAVK